MANCHGIVWPLLLCALGLVIEFITAYTSTNALFSNRNDEVETAISLNSPGNNDEPRPDYADENPFSACLLVMDENHRLIEWVAYHYFALNLRHLVLAVDPLSSERPLEVLDRWKDKMVIEEWTDEWYMDPREKEKLVRRSNSSQLDHHSFHKMRQRLFYKRCASHLKIRKRTWTIMFDVDEYMVVNQKLVNNTSSLVSKPGHVQTLLDELVSSASTVSNKTFLGYHYSKPCIMLPRITYGHTESSDKKIQKGVPSFIDPSRFDTLRWRHRTASGKSAVLGKAIVDVSQVPEKQFFPGAFGNAHRPLDVCTTSSTWVQYKLHIGLHHYIGSWEQYNYRKNDARDGLLDRRGKDVWMRKGSASVEVDDEVRPWIQGFLQQFSNDTETVARLLDGAGLPSNRSRAFDKKKALE